jgi:hypothetical protein
MKKNLLPPDVKPARSPGRSNTRLTLVEMQRLAFDFGWERRNEGVVAMRRAERNGASCCTGSASCSGKRHQNQW